MSPTSLKRTLTLLGALAFFAACGGSTTMIGGADSGGGNSGEDASGGDALGADGNNTDTGNVGRCGGGAPPPACYVLGPQGCCTPGGFASCANGVWSCPSGSVMVNQCSACADSGTGTDGSIGADASCGPPPPGVCLCGSLECVNGGWTCVGSCDASTGDATSTSCGNTTCDPGNICVVQTNGGGACLPVPDSGMCPVNYVLEGGCCVFSQTTYSCQPMPQGCNGALSCGCASQLCMCMCGGASGSELDCVCAFP